MSDEDIFGSSPGSASPRSSSEDSEPHVSEVATQDLHLHPRGDQERLNRELSRQRAEDESAEHVDSAGDGVGVSHGSSETEELSVPNVKQEVQPDLAAPTIKLEIKSETPPTRSLSPSVSLQRMKQEPQAGTSLESTPSTSAGTSKRKRTPTARFGSPVSPFEVNIGDEASSLTPKRPRPMGNFPCDECDEIFATSYRLRRHTTEVHRGVKVSCPHPVCKSQVLARGLEYHFMNGHNKDVKARVTFSVCKVCGVLSNVVCECSEDGDGSQPLDVLTHLLARQLEVSHTWLNCSFVSIYLVSGFSSHVWSLSPWRSLQFSLAKLWPILPMVGFWRICLASSLQVHPGPRASTESIPLPNFKSDIHMFSYSVQQFVLYAEGINMLYRIDHLISIYFPISCINIHSFHLWRGKYRSLCLTGCLTFKNQVAMMNGEKA